jgi:hydroxyacylglutathione hydrolase
LKVLDEGSINIGLKGKYATWAGSLLSHDAPIVVIGDGDNEEEAVMRLGRIGFDNVAGYLKDGMEALECSSGTDSQTVPRITAAALAEQIDRKQKHRSFWMFDRRRNMASCIWRTVTTSR